MGSTTHIIICILATTIWLGCQAPQEETVPTEPLAEPIRHPLRGKHPFSEWELCVVEHSWQCCGFKTTFQEMEIEHFYDDEHRLQYHSVTLGDSIYNLFFRFHDEKSPQKNFHETYQYSPTSQYQVSVSP